MVRLCLVLCLLCISPLYCMEKDQSKSEKVRSLEELRPDHEERCRQRRRLMVVVTPTDSELARYCGMLGSPIDEAGNVRGTIFVFPSAASLSSAGSDEDHREIDYPDSDPDASEDEVDRDEFI